MKKRFIYFSLTASLLFLLTTQAQGEVVNLSSGLISEGRASLPTKEIVTGDNFVKVTYTFENTNIHAETKSPGVYTIQYDGFGKSSTPGYPSLPMRADKIVIPDGCTAQVELVESEYTDIKMELLPSFVEESYSVITQPDMIISDTFAPEKCVEIQNTGEYRGVRFCNVGVTPFQYNSSTKTLRAYKSLTYQLTFEENQISKVRKSSVNPSISENDPIRNSQNVIWPTGVSDLLPTPDSISQIGIDLFSPSNRENHSYLVVTSTALRPAAERFAEHKHKMGFNMYVETKDFWSISQVQEIIKDYYERDPNLFYTLFIGDHAIIPPHRKPFGGLSMYDYYTDLDYFCLGGNNDMYPDIYSGRWPISNLSEAEILVDKTISYETEPPRDSRYLSSAVLASFFQDNDSNGYEDFRFILSTEDIARYIDDKYENLKRIYSKPEYCIPTNWNNDEFADGSEIYPELRVENFKWHTDIDSIYKAINDGCSLLFYYAHGKEQGWYNPFFQTENLEEIKNKNKYPIYIGISCLTGRYEVNDNFVRNMLSKKEAGCVASIAGTDQSLCYSNDAFSLSLFSSIWPNPGIYPSIGSKFQKPTSIILPVYTLGEILQTGLNRMEEILPQDNKPMQNSPFKTVNQYMRQIYHCFGDPSLPIYWTQYDIKKVTRKQDAFNRDLIFSTKEKAEFLVNYIGTDTYLKFRTNQIKFQDKNKDKYHIWVRLPSTHYASIWEGAISNGSVSASISKCAVSQDSKLKVEIDSPESLENASYLNLMDKYGRNVKSLKIDQSEANITIDISNIDHGFYIVTLVSDGEVISNKQILK